MISLLVFLAILGILIIVHEFGHFIIAKKVGVRVEKFSLGFGPIIFRRKVGETEYAVNSIPLGGYVKLGGRSRYANHCDVDSGLWTVYETSRLGLGWVRMGLCAVVVPFE